MAMSFHNHQPPNQRNILPDEENDMTYYDRRDETFEVEIVVSDLTGQPPWFGARQIDGIQIEGTIVEDYEYDVVDGHRDPASCYGTYSYEDVTVTYWANDGALKVLEIELDELSEGDLAWGRLMTEDQAASEAANSQPFYQFLVDNREIAGYFPEEIR